MTLESEMMFPMENCHIPAGETDVYVKCQNLVLIIKPEALPKSFVFMLIVLLFYIKCWAQSQLKV